MDTAKSSAPPRTRTTRHHRVDHEFLDLLEEDFGISQFSLRSAFMGVVPAAKKKAIALCEWAIRSAAGDPDEAGDALRAWAKKHGRGTYDRRLQDGEPMTFSGQPARGPPRFMKAEDLVCNPVLEGKRRGESNE